MSTSCTQERRRAQEWSNTHHIVNEVEEDFEEGELLQNEDGVMLVLAGHQDPQADGQLGS